MDWCGKVLVRWTLGESKYGHWIIRAVSKRTERRYQYSIWYFDEYENQDASCVKLHFFFLLLYFVLLMMVMMICVCALLLAFSIMAHFQYQMLYELIMTLAKSGRLLIRWTWMQAILCKEITWWKFFGVSVQVER